MSDFVMTPARLAARRLMTPGRLAQRVIAGKASYRAMVAKAIKANTGENGIVNLDMAARHLTALRRFHMAGLRSDKQRGVTSQYMQQWAVDLGLLPEEQMP